MNNLQTGFAGFYQVELFNIIMWSNKVQLHCRYAMFLKVLGLEVTMELKQHK